MFDPYQPHPYAGFWLRFVAYLIDSVLMTVAFCPLAFVLGIVGALADWGAGGPPGQGAVSPMMTVLVYALLIVGSWLYYALMESSGWQGTVGKKLLNIRLTDFDGERISFGRATGRFFAKLIMLVPVFFVIVLAAAVLVVSESVALFLLLLLVAIIISLGGYVMAAFTEKKQALHDMIASTLVLQGAGAGAGAATLNQPPPPPPSDFGYGGGRGGYGGQGGYGQGGDYNRGGGYAQGGGYNQGGGGYGQGS